MLDTWTDYDYYRALVQFSNVVTGKIIPSYDLDGQRYSPLRYEDVVYLAEAGRLFLHDYYNTMNLLTPTLYNLPKYYQTLYALWRYLYQATNASDTTYNLMYVNDGIKSVDITVNSQYIVNKSFMASRNLLDTSIADILQSSYNFKTARYDVDKMKRLYDCLFKDVWHYITYSDSYILDKRFIYAKDTITGDWVYNTSDNNRNVVTTTGTFELANYLYIRPKYNGLEGVSQLTTVRNSSGLYEYVYNGATTHLDVTVNLKRSDVTEAYALVQMKCTNESTYRSKFRYISVPLTKVSGTTWKFRLVDYQKMRDLYTSHGADWSKVGTTSSRSSNFIRYSFDVAVSGIFCKYDFKYKKGFENWSR